MTYPGKIGERRNFAAVYQNILVPLDGTSFSETVLPHALGLAQVSGGRCHLVRALPEMVYPTHGVIYPGAMPIGYQMNLDLKEQRERAHLEATEYLRVLSQDLFDVGVETTSTCEFGEPGTVILECARKLQADVILVASHQRSGLSRWLAPNTATELTLKASCPVMVVQGDHEVCRFADSSLIGHLMNRLEPHFPLMSPTTGLPPMVLKEVVPKALAMIMTALAEERHRGPELKELFAQLHLYPNVAEDLPGFLASTEHRPGLGLVSKVFHERGAWAASALSENVGGMDSQGSLNVLAILIPVVLTELHGMSESGSELRGLLKAELEQSPRGIGLHKASEMTEQIVSAL